MAAQDHLRVGRWMEWPRKAAIAPDLADERMVSSQDWRKARAVDGLIHAHQASRPKRAIMGSFGAPTTPSTLCTTNCDVLFVTHVAKKQTRQRVGQTD